MNYIIDKNSARPAYLQLYECFVKDIISGVYPYLSRLPSKRTIAEETGVSVITAEHAMELLTEEGYAEARERSGIYVIYKKQDFQGTPALFEREDIISEPVIHQASDLPFGILSRTMRKVLQEYGEHIMERSPNRGLELLRQEICAYLARSRGIHIHSSQVVIGSGAEYLYGMVAQLLGDKEVFALEDPSYEKISRVYETFGIITEKLKLLKSGIDPKALEKTSARVLHVTPFHSYPSGITADVSKKNAYLAWAENRDGIIIEDNYDSELTVSKKPEEPLFSMTDQDNVIYLNTFSRTIGRAMRMGYMVLPEKLSGLFEEKLGFYSCTVPVFEQYVLYELLKSGDYERHINRVRRKRRKDMGK